MGDHSAYAVHCDCKSIGKRFSGSKRQVSWKFVFAEDRDRAHEVTLKHSIASGKREITMDGRPIHLSRKMTIRADFEHGFPFAPGHLLRVTIKEEPNCFVYTLFIDNVPFRHLPHTNSRKREKANGKSTTLNSGSSTRNGSGSGSGSSTRNGNGSSTRNNGRASTAAAWDPFADAAASSGGQAKAKKSPKKLKKKGTSAKKKKRPGAKKAPAVAKQASTDHWVPFGAADPPAAPAAGIDDLLSFSSEPVAMATGPGPAAPLEDLLGGGPISGDTGNSLNDLSSLYAATNDILTQPAARPMQGGAAAAGDQHAWGGLVDLNNMSTPSSLPTAVAPQMVPMFGSRGGAGLMGSSNEMAQVRQPAGMMGSSSGMNKGMNAPRGFSYNSAVPTRNSNFASNNRKQAARAPASAFEADPFARFN